MSESANLIDELRTLRDEIQLKIHLGSQEIQEEWSKLERHWQAFSARAELSRSASEVSEALMLLGEELGTAYRRVRKAL